MLVTNLRGPWLFTERLVKALIADQERTPQRQPRRRGSILFISSLHDRFVAEDAHYGVSKAGVPADIARVALFMLSDAWSGYVTDQNIAVDGGLSLHNWLDE